MGKNLLWPFVYQCRRKNPKPFNQNKLEGILIEVVFNSPRVFCFFFFFLAVMQMGLYSWGLNLSGVEDHFGGALKTCIRDIIGCWRHRGSGWAVDSQDEELRVVVSKGNREQAGQGHINVYFQPDGTHVNFRRGEHQWACAVARIDPSQRPQ